MKRVIFKINFISILLLSMLKTGCLFTFITALFTDRYEMSFWDEDLNILKVRITRVQKHEERRTFYDLYGIDCLSFIYSVQVSKCILKIR